MLRWKTIAIFCITACAPLSFAQSGAPRDPAQEAPREVRATEVRTEGRPSVDVVRVASPEGPYIQVEDPAAAIPEDPRDPNFAKRHLEAVRIYYNNEGKKEKSTFLGVSSSPVTPALREQLKLPKGIGLVVDFIESKSPAEEAGLKQYDVMHKLGDQLLVNAHQFAVLVRTYKGGDEVTITIIRQGESRQVKAKLIEKEVSALDEKNPWGTPPGPWGQPAGTDVNFTFAQRAPLARSQGIPVLSEVPIINRLFIKDAARNGDMRWTDDQHELNIAIRGDSKRLVATDKAGKILFDGPINTEEERRAIPADLREKVNHLERSLAPVPTTQPHTSLVPGFGQPDVIYTREVDADGTDRIKVLEDRRIGR